MCCHIIWLTTSQVCKSHTECKYNYVGAMLRPAHSGNHHYDMSHKIHHIYNNITSIIMAKFTIVMYMNALQKRVGS